MHQDSGFSLLEAIVSLAIISASLGLMMQGLAASTKAANRAENEYLATILARSNIHRVGYDIPLEPSLLGESDGARDWEVEIMRLDLEGVNDGPFVTYEIRSRVFWGAGGAERSVELVTVKSGRGAGSQ